MTSTKPFIVAQITDTHLFAESDGQMYGIPTAKSLEAVINKLKQLQPQPDILLLTGDLSQDETPASYYRLTSLITPLQIPTYWIPGNHDILPVMEAALNTPPISSAKFFNLGGWQFLLLRTNVPGRVEGQLSPENLEWLDFKLRQTRDRPALIALHHAPIPIGSQWMDDISLHNPEPLLKIVDRHPQVKIVLCGHIHQELDKQRGPVRYLGTPSTCIQFKGHNPNFAIDDKPPGFRLLSLHADGSFTTKVEWVNCGFVPDRSAKGY
jgi:Icc protein